MVHSGPDCSQKQFRVERIYPRHKWRGVNLDAWWYRWKKAILVTSNGNRVYVGFSPDGLNVNNNWDDNRNSNLGLASSRNIFLGLEH
jgi:hypothetical protein